jgi:hypothetical protein
VAGEVTLSVGAARTVGVDVARDVDVLGIAGAAAGHDGHIVEPEGPPRRLPDADLDFSHEATSLLTAVRGPRGGPY